MSFNKTSFLCLILMMAVFIAAPVLAHQPELISTSDADSNYWNNHTFAENHDGKANDTNTAPAILKKETDHTHLAAPTVESIELVDDILDDMVKVDRGNFTRLVNNADKNPADLSPSFTIPAGAAGEFQVEVTFDQNVYDTGTTTTLAANDLGSTDFMITAASHKDNVNIYGTSEGQVKADVARKSKTDTTFHGDTFIITFTVPDALIVTNTSETDQTESRPIDVWVTLKAGVIYNADRLVSGVTHKATTNTASSQAKFTVVDTLPTADTAAPVLTIAKPVLSGDNVTFTITETEANPSAGANALGHTPPDNMDITVTKNGKALARGDITFTAAVGSTKAKVVVAAKEDDTVILTIRAGAVVDLYGQMSAAVSSTYKKTPVAPDEAGPTVKITSNPASRAALPNSGNVVFTFKFNEALGTGSDAFTLGDVTVTGGTTVDFAGSGLNYTLTVTPTTATTDVKVAVTGTVQDAANNDLNTAGSTPAGATFTYKHHDTVPPTVAISAEKFKDAAGNIIFIFDFNEPIKTAGDGAFTADDIDRVNSDVAEIVSAPAPYTKGGLKDAYSVKIKPKKTGSVSIQIKINSVKDTADNPLARDYSGVWNPPTDVSTTMVAITGPPLLDSLTASENTIKITVTPKGGTITNKLAAGEVTISNGSKSGFAYADATNTATFNVTPNHGAQFVTVSVAAGAVADSQKNVSTAASKVFEVAPLITVPANGHVVIVRDRHKDDTILSDQPTLALPGVPTPAPDIVAVPWEHMPDLKVLFNVGGTGTGGGALILKKAHSQPANMAVNSNNITISEIMWATDIGILGNLQNDEQAKQQWIELHNRHSHAVKVFIYARAGTDILGSHNDVSNPSGTIVDVVTNYFNGSPGNDRWNLPGQDGNSRAGDNFVSMRRKIDKGNYLNGRASGSWEASPDAYYRAIATVDTSKVYEFRGTPGRDNTFSPAPRPTLRDKTTPVPSSPVIFNEVANRSNKDLEWIELRNVTGSEQNLNNYLISMVTAVNKEEVLYRFPADNKAKIPANGVILLVATDPWDKPDHPLAVGWNIDKNAEDQVAGWGTTLDDKDVRYRVVSFGSNGLPDDGKFVLILRQAKTDGKPPGTGNADLNRISDIAGWHDDLKTGKGYTNKYSETNLWPLYQFGAPQFSNNKLHADTVHWRRHVRSNKDDRGGAGAVDNNNGKSAFTDIGYSGIGYKRQAARTSVNGGTPGYHGIERSLATQAKLVISEMMLNQGSGTGRNALPQWIEIYNPTDYAVQLDADAGWRLIVEEERIALRTLNFKTKGTVKRVLPGESILVVSSTARSYGSDYLPATTTFPSTRVFNVYREGLNAHFGMTDRYAGFLNPDSFNLRLVDGKGNVSDEIGNLDGNIRTSDTAKWEFSEDTIAKDGYRTSLIRILDDGVARNGLSIDASNVLPIGAKEMDDSVDLRAGMIPAKYAWIRASQTNFDPIFVRHTWYGDEQDYGTPLHRVGAFLPVELSSFRPTLEDGKVVVRWTTESELDNAGFNIYRSETRNGEFKQVNAQLIEGAGTTGERTVYEWVDTSAKPGVVYYYQIEDVSFAGERQALAINRLKGYVNAKDKLTTRWGELKKTLQ